MSLKGSVTVGPEAPLVLTAGKNSNLECRRSSEESLM